jgi:AraC-like DNA-binding protein
VAAFAQISEGCERRAGGCHIPRHRHAQAYAALILEGGYEESGSLGRYHARAGQVLLHRSFDAHLDRFVPHGARILNLLLPAEPRCGWARIADPDEIVRLAERDAREASATLSARLQPLEYAGSDWPELLAQELRRTPSLRLGEWAARHGLAAATLSRGFRQVFALAPAAFRAEARAHHALSLIRNGQLTLAQVAADAGYADQAHMTRALRTLCGQPPAEWRRSNAFKTARRVPAY